MQCCIDFSKSKDIVLKYTFGQRKVTDMNNLKISEIKSTLVSKERVKVHLTYMYT